MAVMILLLASKIQKPVHFEEWISRENMVAIQQKAVHSNILFLSAPTGYGKTTFLTHWSYELDENIAWLTVDETDNNALQFFKYIVYTVYSACNILSEKELQKKLSIADRKEVDEMWDFYKAMDKRLQKPVRLIIDDFHHITEPELLEMIQYFVMNLPALLKICIASRHVSPFPVELWHSMFTVTEVRMQQLRFTANDMKMYLKLHPKQEECVWKEFTQTEGWPAGLRNVLQTQETHYRPPTNRHQQFTMDVLTNDLWSGFSSSAQHFLLVTSILHSMDQKLCDALLENEESLVHLKNLEEKGFFIERDMKKESHYRYHPLFAVALQQNLQKSYPEEFVAALHKRAAGVYFKQGDIVQAISHAVKGRAYPLASTWMMNYGEEIIKNRQTSVFTSWCYEFEKARIPLSLDLQLLFAFALLSEYNTDEAERVTMQMTADKNRKEWNAFTERSTSAAYDYFLMKSYITIVRMGGVTEVANWLQKGFDLHVQQSSKLYLLPLQFNKKEPVLSRTQLGVPKKIVVQQDELRYKEAHPNQANKISVIGYYHGIEAEKLYLKGSMKEAVNEQVEALLLAHHFQDPGLLIPMYILRCKLYLAAGEPEKAHETAERALHYTDDEYWRGFLHALQAYIYLKENLLSEAEKEFALSQVVYVEELQNHPLYSLVTARLLLEQGHWEKALKKTLRVKFEALQQGQIITFIEATVLESVCYARKESWLEMSHALQEAMISSKEYGYTQLFAEETSMASMLKEYVHVRKQLDDTNWSQVPFFYVEHLVQATKVKTRTMDTLTPREQDVYSLLVLGESNSKIAKNLALTEGSVRVYLTSIYGKLSVRSRTQAMLKAYKII